MADGGTNQLKVRPVRSEIPRGTLLPGEYLRQVTVVEAKGAKAASFGH